LMTHDHYKKQITRTISLWLQIKN